MYILIVPSFQCDGFFCLFCFCFLQHRFRLNYPEWGERGEEGGGEIKGKDTGGVKGLFRFLTTRVSVDV